MTKSKTWAKPELKQLSVDRTLGGTEPNFFEDQSNVFGDFGEVFRSGS